MSLKKTVIFAVLAALTTTSMLAPLSLSAASPENTSVTSVNVNPYRSKFSSEYTARIDRLVQSILARGKDLQKDAYVAYLSNISDAMTKLAAQEKYRNKQEVQEIVGYLNFEISKIRSELVDGTTFMEDLVAVINASAPTVQSPVAETPRQPSPVAPVPVPVAPTVAAPKIPLPTLQISNMSDGSAYVSWTYVQGQKYNLNYIGGMGGNLRNEMDFTSAMMGGCTYKRSIGNGIVLCSGKWNNFPGSYSIQTYNADGSK